MSGYYPHAREIDPLKLVRGIRDLFDGRSNAFGSFVCTANQATTVVSDPHASPDSTILLTARHANAAAELGNGTIYISAKAAGSFTVTHANSATANRNFDYAIVG